ncbi:hypothetical protein HZC00_03960 [Candidatus Kaiserbacteria bacterium]|nr:hypothetical protein [Candidatus Kaiserbacteria bacterium]
MKKREDGILVFKDENRLDGKLSPTNWIRNEKRNHYDTIYCPSCNKPGRASAMRTFACYYTNTNGEVVHGEVPFCSYECLLNWLGPSHMGKTSQ